MKGVGGANDRARVSQPAAVAAGEEAEDAARRMGAAGRRSQPLPQATATGTVAVAGKAVCL